MSLSDGEECGYFFGRNYAVFVCSSDFIWVSGEAGGYFLLKSPPALVP